MYYNPSQDNMPSWAWRMNCNPPQDNRLLPERRTNYMPAQENKPPLDNNTLLRAWES
jgi:hypothetical protein